MFAVTGGTAKHSEIIRLWEQRAIACGLTPVVYDLGGLGYGNPSLASPTRPGTIEKALADLDGHFVYTDPDALFRGIPSQLVGDWPVAVTVRPKSEWAKVDRIDAGVMYFSDGPDCQEFVKLWLSLTARVGNDQRALNMLMADVKRSGFTTVHSADCEIKVQSFPTELYNCPVGSGVHRAIIVRAGDTPEDQLVGACGLSHGVVKPGGVYETFVSDGDYQISRFVKERDTLAPAMNVLPGVYEGHPEAVIVSCFYNPQNNPYRLMAFAKFFRSIKHLNFRIVECLIGPDAKPQLPDHPSITRVYADDLIWHKETLLNMAVADLPPEFKYVFIIDADVLFTNPKWMVDGVKALQDVGVIQPFEFCVHLEKNHLQPTFDTSAYEAVASDPEKRHPSMWRSFSANVANDLPCSRDTCYDAHGHVGFAWGFQRRVLEQCPLFEKALIGGADHILAHAAAGQEPHPCITKSFTANLDEVLDWSKKFHNVSYGDLGYAPGYLFHIWHGDIAARQYLKRIKEFTGPSRAFVKGPNGMYKLPPQNRAYVNRYYQNREVRYDEFDWIDPTFFEDMGYLIWDIWWMFGQPNYNQETFPLDFPQDVPDMGGQEVAPFIDPDTVSSNGGPVELFTTGEGQGLADITPEVIGDTGAQDDANQDGGNFS